jgi:hypothetical protein
MELVRISTPVPAPGAATAATPAVPEAIAVMPVRELGLAVVTPIATAVAEQQAARAQGACVLMPETACRYPVAVMVASHVGPPMGWSVAQAQAALVVV